MKRAFLTTGLFIGWSAWFGFYVAHTAIVFVTTGDWRGLAARLVVLALYGLMTWNWLRDIRVVGLFVGVAFWLSQRGVYIPQTVVQWLERWVNALLQKDEAR